MRDKESFERPRIEEGFYNCVCKEVKEISPGTYGDRIAIIAEISRVRGRPEKDVELAKVVYLKMTPNSGSTKAVEAFGFEFKPGEDFDFDKLVGKTAQAVVEDYEYVDEDGATQTASSISKFKPLKEGEDAEVIEEKVGK